MRRFGRVRLVDCPGDQIRKNTRSSKTAPTPSSTRTSSRKISSSGSCENATSRSRPLPARPSRRQRHRQLGWRRDHVPQAKMHPEQYRRRDFRPRPRDTIQGDKLVSARYGGRQAWGFRPVPLTIGFSTIAGGRKEGLLQVRCLVGEKLTFVTGRPPRSCTVVGAYPEAIARERSFEPRS